MSNEPDVIKILNGTSQASGSETKTPFLIGVAGGTASGKVFILKLLSLYLILKKSIEKEPEFKYQQCNQIKIFVSLCSTVNGLQTNYRTIGTGRCGARGTSGRLHQSG